MPVITLVSVPTLVSEQLVPFDHFDIRFKQAVIETGEASLDMPGAAISLVIKYPKLDVRTSTEVAMFFQDWCIYLLMDPVSKERKGLYPVEYAAVVDVDGTHYYTFPTSTPGHGTEGLSVTMILSPVPQAS